MNTRFQTSSLAHAFTALLLVTSALAESPALKKAAPEDPGVGKPGSGAPASLGHIDLKPEPAIKLQVRSNGITNSTVAQVQRALKQRGCYGGPVDGNAGVGTRAAVSTFRKKNGLPLTTRIDRPLLDALGL